MLSSVFRTLVTLKHSPLLVKTVQFHRQRFVSTTIMSKKALLLITEGAEEMEAVIVADVLRRAEVCFCC